MSGADARPRGGLVAVHAHPDDESLSTGALLATWAAAGQPVTVVTCTRGERGEVIDTPAHPTGLRALEGDGPALAAHRETELAAALAALGVRDHVYLDTVPAAGVAAAAVPAGAGVPDGAGPVRLVDSGMRWVAPGLAGPDPDPVLAGPGEAFATVPLDAAAARLVAVLDERRPAVVATYDPQGGYGHPDHVRVHAVTRRALELLAAGDGPRPELWCVAQRAPEVRAARRALATLPEVAALRAHDPSLSLPDPDEPLPPVATWAAPRTPTLDVRVAPVLDRVLAAQRAHATQVQAVTPVRGGGAVVAVHALSNDVLTPVLAIERYVRRPVVRGSVTP